MEILEKKFGHTFFLVILTLSLCEGIYKGLIDFLYILK